MILKGRRNKKEAVEKLTSDKILYVSVVVNNMLIDNMIRSHIDTYCLFYFVYVYMHKHMHICMCVHAQIWACTYVCERQRWLSFSVVLFIGEESHVEPRAH